MRKEFSQWLENTMAADDDVVFLTGDLGFMAFENVSSRFGRRFINVGVAEQNMIGLAAGLASEGCKPICYSIAPFAVFRPFEQIRLDVCIHKMNVKIVGNGGGYGYGIMGPTHHALEDIACLSSLPNMKCFVPLANEDLYDNAQAMMHYQGPSYLRLGAGPWPERLPLLAYSPMRKHLGNGQVTAIALGPTAQNLVAAELDLRVEGRPPVASVYSVSCMPLTELTSDFIADAQRTGKVFVAEEHTRRGGLAEQVAFMLMEKGIHVQMLSLASIGYPDGTYGSQSYHRKQSGLDISSIVKSLLAFSEAKSIK